MKMLSTSNAAKRLGIGVKTLSRYIAEGKVPPPKIVEVGGGIVHMWTEEEIERVRHLLPKIANGRKTRYQKQSAASKQQSPKTKTPPRAAVPHKSRKKK